MNKQFCILEKATPREIGHFREDFEAAFGIKVYDASAIATTKKGVKDIIFSVETKDTLKLVSECMVLLGDRFFFWEETDTNRYPVDILKKYNR